MRALDGYLVRRLKLTQDSFFKRLYTFQDKRWSEWRFRGY